MDNKPEKKQDNEEITQKNNESKSNLTLAIVTSICLILSIIGISLSIYNTVKINQKDHQLTLLLDELRQEENNYDCHNCEKHEDWSDWDDEEDDDYFGLPQDADSIANIEIYYNDYNDYVDIYDDSIGYYTDSGFVEILPTDNSEFIQYFFDNDLQYLGNNIEKYNETWGITVYTTDNHRSYVGGSEVPEWVKDLLKKLDVDTHSHKS